VRKKGVFASRVQKLGYIQKTSTALAQESKQVGKEPKSVDGTL